ncbi:MAG: serine hydrolase [Bacteroidetes bacterium]|nr:serine hydrolase [Bacteroidota bacterium]MCY4205841.1 serine hydrolase [Bacteroidota bacterium]
MLRNIFILFTLPLACSALGQTLEAKLDSLFSAVDQPNVPGAAIVITRGNTIHFSKGYGIADLEHNVPVTDSTVFMVASVSKQFTAYAIALLATHGEISLQDPVTDYIPELNSVSPSITIQHLVYHTSGLRDEFTLLALAGYRMDDQITKEDILRLIYRQRELNFNPGTRYLYSNSGYTLLAEIIERVSGQSFADWTHENLFQPLGMMDSHFRSTTEQITPNVASGYITTSDGYRAQRVNYSSVGASGLYTTTLDLGRWLIALRNSELGGSQTQELAHTRGITSHGDTLNYAFGLSYGRFRGTEFIGHSGSHRGYRAWAGRFPDHDLGIAVLGNLEEFDPHQMAQKVASLFIEEKSLYAYEGIYHSRELDNTIYISLESDTLRASSQRGKLATLSRTGRDSFRSDTWYLSSFDFKRDTTGVIGFHTSSGRSHDIWFEKKDQ